MGFLYANKRYTPAPCSFTEVGEAKTVGMDKVLAGLEDFLKAFTADAPGGEYFIPQFLDVGDIFLGIVEDSDIMLDRLGANRKLSHWFCQTKDYIDCGVE